MKSISAAGRLRTPSTGATVYHAVSTCRMGSDPLAVVDADLKVRGLFGLRVVDASVMPTTPSANTDAAMLMIAEKAADLLRRNSGRTNNGAAAS